MQQDRPEFIRRDARSDKISISAPSKSMTDSLNSTTTTRSSTAGDSIFSSSKASSICTSITPSTISRTDSAKGDVKELYKRLEKVERTREGALERYPSYPSFTPYVGPLPGSEDQPFTRPRPRPKYPSLAKARAAHGRGKDTIPEVLLLHHLPLFAPSMRDPARELCVSRHLMVAVRKDCGCRDMQLISLVKGYKERQATPIFPARDLDDEDYMTDGPPRRMLPYLLHSAIPEEDERSEASCSYEIVEPSVDSPATTDVQARSRTKVFSLGCSKKAVLRVLKQGMAKSAGQLLCRLRTPRLL
ncbi:hypothetical protein DL93DRAFT_2231769 [Clavulina sp. PMI_390]|nr:hypothetical protein DL93DRAFT_2231769 [Clavulina sp. PMI_390]